ncbi:MFS transporter [Agromyces subbeticus]|uniref:MFS transporter n=1 Tax=Agromyces subbeticus TaxID=293890 RepID=UPI0003B61911|nr:MFS transporter [Agromyces subbeticus]
MSSALTTPLRALLVAVALGGFAQSLAGSAGGLLAEDIAGSAATAGLPQSMLVLGSAIGALGISRVSVRTGRGAALAGGAVLGVCGCALVVAGAAAALLPAVLVGSLLFGVGNAAVMLSRYAGAAGVDPARRVSAIAAVLVATTIGAVLGPLFLGPADDAGQALGLPPLAGCYVAGAVGMAAAAACFAAFGRRTPVPERSAEGDPRADDDVAPTERRRDTIVGVGVLSLANVVMVGVMTALPLHLMHLHADMSVVGVIISLHIGAMFAPSPISAALVRRLGAEGTAVTAGSVLVAATVVVASGAASVIAIGAGVLLVGLGWNLALVSGSAILTRSAPERLRLRREGWGEVGMGTAAAGGGAMSGVVLELTGFATLALCGCAAAVVLIGVAALASRRTVIATRDSAADEDAVGRGASR